MFDLDLEIITSYDEYVQFIERAGITYGKGYGPDIQPRQYPAYAGADWDGEDLSVQLYYPRTIDGEIWIKLRGDDGGWVHAQERA